MNFLNIDPSTIDPNLVYLILVAGLWAGVTAVYSPGTTILEILALVGLVVAVVLLSAMPTNWIAAGILATGVVIFIIMPFIQRQSIGIPISGLALQAVGGLLLFNEHPTQWLLIGFTVFISLVYYWLVLLPILNKTPVEAKALYDDTIIGARGRVLTPINPIGTIQLSGETWTARSEKPLKVGDEVVVIDRQGLQLTVEGLKQKRAPKSTDED